MSIVVFLLFRSPVPSFAVIICAFSDIIIALGFMNLLGSSFLGTFAALLMLIGYSVDSDILLTNRLSNVRNCRRESFSGYTDRGYNDQHSSCSTCNHVLSLYLSLSDYSFLLTDSSTFADSIVLIAGLFADIMNTWLLNTGILRWYILKPEFGGRYNR